MSTTTIQLDTHVRDQLKSVGRKGETYGEIIERLLKVASYTEFMEDQYRILQEEKRWTRLKDVR
ncbi:MAG: hypothetical protein WCA77_08635 [Thermoplasmata archaeon]